MVIFASQWLLIMEYSVLNNDIKFVGGVGEARAKLLAKELGVKTIRDMLYCFPFRYIDRSLVSRIHNINEKNVGTYHQLVVKVIGKSFSGEGRSRRFTVVVTDGGGQAELVWFQGIKWVENRFEVGRKYVVFGRPSLYHGVLSMVHPDVEPAEGFKKNHQSDFQGVYSTTERLSVSISSKMFRNIIANCWELVKGQIPDYMPEYLRKRHGLITLEEALYNIHFPQSPELLRQAQYRLKFDELFGIQLNIQAKRTARQSSRGFVFHRVGDIFNTFFNTKMPFKLTEGQKKAMREIRHDTVSGRQMNRLLQGDVGSGKTIVALLSMLLAIDNGYQACMMVPTEILAQQHYNTFASMTEGLPIKVALLTGSTRTAERRAILEEVASGKINILIGTHALIEERVVFANLGFVVIDEQHRFGVEQRAKLWTKNNQTPHILVMTATPIPRTLAMTVYGDLDSSMINERPPGRRPIQTLHLTDASRMRITGFIKRQIRDGFQVYIVYPLIDESENMDYKNLQQGFEDIVRDFPLPDYRVAVCHGRMKPEDKEAAMNEFKEGRANILVATSVIEVGVDVPKATAIIIESAERFGLAQLHQLRGRVGRGKEQSYCILVSSQRLSRDAKVRLEAMCNSTDGFVLAELDMRLRGAGDISGTQQSGVTLDLKIANPAFDNQVVRVTREAAISLLAADPTLDIECHRALKTLRDRYTNRHTVDFSKIS